MTGTLIISSYDAVARRPELLRGLTAELRQPAGYQLWVVRHLGELVVVARSGDPGTFRGVMRIPWAWVDGVEHDAGMPHLVNEVTGGEARPGDVRGCPPSCPLRVAVEEELR